jgi:AbrB family looped-hinge helix DNA binding protein
MYIPPAQRREIVSNNRPETRIVKQLRSGQVTIPADFRKELGIADNSFLQITMIQGELRIKPVRVTERAAGSAWVKELYNYFAPARQEAANYSEEEINADIDAAVHEVRAKHDPSRL